MQTPQIRNSMPQSNNGERLFTTFPGRSFYDHYVMPQFLPARARESPLLIFVSDSSLNTYLLYIFSTSLAPSPYRNKKKVDGGK